MKKKAEIMKVYRSTVKNIFRQEKLGSHPSEFDKGFASALAWTSELKKKEKEEITKELRRKIFGS